MPLITLEEAARKVVEVVRPGLIAGLGRPIPGKMCVEAAVCYVYGLPHGDDPPCVAPTLRILKIGLNDANWSSPKARAKGMLRLSVAQLGSAGVLDEKALVERVIDNALRVTVPSVLRAAASMQSEDHKSKLLAAAVECEKSKSSADAARYAARAADVVADANFDAAYAADYAAYAAACAARYAAQAADAFTADHAAYAAAYAAHAAVCAAYAVADANVDAAYAADYAAYAAACAADAVAAANVDAAYADAVRDKFLSEYAEWVVQLLIELKAPGCQYLHFAEAA